MNDFLRACAVAEVPPGTAYGCVLAGMPVCVARSATGEFFAVLDECSHAEVALSDGDVEDSTIECWLHGSRFDLTTGAALGPPATEPVPVYEVRIEGTDVLVRVTDD